MKNILIGCFLLATSFGIGQEKILEGWTINDKAQYAKLKQLANYVHKKHPTEISKDSLFKNYIYLDHVLTDTVTERRDRRLIAFDTLFQYFKKTVDRIGVENLEAKPVRFYKNHKIYESFDSHKNQLQTVDGEQKHINDDNVFAYYRKKEPKKPLGLLLFDPETDKLISWIMINQGGYRYFITFNLL